MFAAHNALFASALKPITYMGAYGSATTGTAPQKVAFTPDGTQAWVTNQSSETVSVIDTSTGTKIADVSNGAISYPTSIAISPSGTKAYVGNNNGVTIVDVATRTVDTTPINTGNASPTGLAFSPDGSKCYAVIGSTYDNILYTINTATKAVTTPYVVGSVVARTGLAISPDGSTAYVSGVTSGSALPKVSVINISANTLTANIDVGAGPIAVAVSPDGSKVYCINNSDNTVSVISTSTNTVTTTISGIGGAPNGLAISPDGTKVYVSSNTDNKVRVIDTTTNTVIAAVPTGTGNNALGIAVSPDGTKIYQANSAKGTVSILKEKPAVSLTGYASAAATSVTIPAHNIGDLIVIFAFRDGATSVPTKPTTSGSIPTWVDVDGGVGGNSCTSRSAYCVATATNHTTGTWTNATGIIAVVITGQNYASPVGGHVVSGSTSGTSANAPAVTLSDTRGASAILHFYGHCDVLAWGSAPTGYTRQTEVTTEVALNTKDVTTSDGAISQPLTSGGNPTLYGYRGNTIEIVT